MNDQETIISLLNEFANPKKMASFFVDNATPDFLFIRPVSYTHLTLPTTDRV